MRLDEYLQESKTPYAEFAEDISVSVTAVHRYAKGERIPQDGVMQRITKRTGGKVTANDFYAQHQ